MSAARVAVVSSEAHTATPAGPALRAAGIARGLAAHGIEATLVAPAGSRAPDHVALAGFGELERLVRSGATVVASGFLLERHPVIAEAAHLVVDAAGPFLLEDLVVHRAETPERRRRILTDEGAVLARLLAAADLVLVAHPRQRDLVFGFMLARGAVQPEVADAADAFDGLFCELPFGPTGIVEAIPPEPHDGLHLVWPGGLWDWLDPVTLVEAVAEARAAGAQVTAELWGARSPDPLVPPSRGAAATGARVRARGIGNAIEIVPWVAHDERAARLARADAAVTLDAGGVEARYAFRTRLVDALAAGVPVIASAGEHVAERATAAGAGFTVPPGDPAALAALLVELARDPARIAAARTRTTALASGWAYETTTAPLAAWCRAPRRIRAGAPSVGANPAETALATARAVAGRARRVLRHRAP